MQRWRPCCTSIANKCPSRAAGQSKRGTELTLHDPLGACSSVSHLCRAWHERRIFRLITPKAAPAKRPSKHADGEQDTQNWRGSVHGRQASCRFSALERGKARRTFFLGGRAHAQKQHKQQQQLGRRGKWGNFSFLCGCWKCSKCSKC